LTIFTPLNANDAQVVSNGDFNLHFNGGGVLAAVENTKTKAAVTVNVEYAYYKAYCGDGNVSIFTGVWCFFSMLSIFC
jgi:hypothetical protein